MIDLSKEKLELDYPCYWIYKVIGYDEIEIKKAVKEVVERDEYKIKLSNISISSLNNTTYVLLFGLFNFSSFVSLFILKQNL